MNSDQRNGLEQRFEELARAGLTRRQALTLASTALGSAGLAALLAACGGSPTTPSSGSAKPTSSGLAEPQSTVEIEYWQYHYESKINLVNKLIPQFEAAHPKIKIKHVDYPYDTFRQKVQTAVQAGGGPDVLNVYYGWVPAYYLADFLRPLPEAIFPASDLKRDFFPMVSSVSFGGKYYALPTAVRTLALFWNKALLSAAGASAPPATWEEMVDVALKTTKRAGGKLVQAGATWDPSGQGHNWWRACLTRQNGATPISADNRKIDWTSDASLESFAWYLDLNRTHHVGEQGFYDDGANAFQTGHAALHVDGSYRVGTLVAKAPDLPWAVAPLPHHKAKASYASFWCNGITRRATGDREVAAARFVQFLASAEVMKQWTPAVGELPARVALAKDPQFTADPRLSAFVVQLEDAYADFLVDESAERKAALDALDKVLLKNADPKQALTEAQAIVQKQFDDYWSQIKK